MSKKALSFVNKFRKELPKGIVALVNLEEKEIYFSSKETLVQFNDRIKQFSFQEGVQFRSFATKFMHSSSDVLNTGDVIFSTIEAKGTAGLFFRLKDSSDVGGGVYVLSCSHILSPEGSSIHDILVAQDMDTNGIDIGELTTEIYLDTDQTVDCAIAKISGDHINDIFFDIAQGHPFSSYQGVVNHGDKLYKPGSAQSNITMGNCIGTTVFGELSKSNGTKQNYADQLMIKSDDDFAKPGDSGSIIINEKKEVCGLLMAVNVEDVIDEHGNVVGRPYSIGLANKISNVWRAMNIDNTDFL